MLKWRARKILDKFPTLTKEEKRLLLNGYSANSIALEGFIGVNKETDRKWIKEIDTIYTRALVEVKRNRLASSAVQLNAVDLALSTSNGGIDFNPQTLQLQTCGKGIDNFGSTELTTGVSSSISFDSANFQGFDFKVIKIEAVTDMNFVMTAGR